MSCVEHPGATQDAQSCADGRDACFQNCSERLELVSEEWAAGAMDRHKGIRTILRFFFSPTQACSHAHDNQRHQIESVVFQSTQTPLRTALGECACTRRALRDRNTSRVSKHCATSVAAPQRVCSMCAPDSPGLRSFLSECCFVAIGFHVSGCAFQYSSHTHAPAHPHLCQFVRSHHTAPWGTLRQSACSPQVSPSERRSTHHMLNRTRTCKLHSRGHHAHALTRTDAHTSKLTSLI